MIILGASAPSSALVSPSGRMIDWSALPAHYSKDVTFLGVRRKAEGGVLPNTEQIASVLLSGRFLGHRRPNEIVLDTLQCSQCTPMTDPAV